MSRFRVQVLDEISAFGIRLSSEVREIQQEATTSSHWGNQKMEFEEPLLEGKLIRRSHRFSAEVKLRSGEEITAHCAHGGQMEGLSDPGNKVLLSQVSDPRRKFQHQLEIIYSGKTAVGIHGGRPLTVVGEAILKGKIQDLAGYARLKRIPRSQQHSRVDMVLEGNGLRSSHLIIESVTHRSEDAAVFPDTKYTQGIEEARYLTSLVREGHRGVIVFVAQRADVESFKLASEIDSDYCEALKDAVERGVEALCVRAQVTKTGIEFDKLIPVVLD